MNNSLRSCWCVSRTGLAIKDVIQVYKREVHFLEVAINEALECLCCVLQPERHLEELKKAKQGDDGQGGSELWIIPMSSIFLNLSLIHI